MPISFLQTWYQKQCNGYWEHSYGVTIQTLDSSGWLVTIDLMETPLEKATMVSIRRENSLQDWLICEVAQKQFRGQGDAQKLLDILAVFRDFANRP